MQDGKLIYENKLSCEKDVEGFVLEGSANLSFPEGKLRMENALSAAEGQKANYVLWCPEDFPSDVRIEWKFRPIKEPGLAILFFAAKGRNGEDIFADSLAERTGEYVQYHHGDIDAFHVSYFRRKEPDERALHTCNLRKSYGFHLVSQGQFYRDRLERKQARHRGRQNQNKPENDKEIEDENILLKSVRMRPGRTIQSEAQKSQAESVSLGRLDCTKARSFQT